MINTSIHKFEKNGWGSLELEIMDAGWDFYSPKSWDQQFFNIKGFGRDTIKYLPFYLQEWQKIQYSYIINKKSAFTPPFELIVNNKIVSRSQMRGNSYLLAGRLSFENEAGLTCIVLRDSIGKVIFELITEVFPQKMDYRSDYKAMLADISAIVQNLAYDVLKTTFKKSRARLKGQSTEVEWWSILDALFEQFIITLEIIKKRAKHEMKRAEQILPVEKIRTASKKNVAWLIKNPHLANAGQQGVRVFPNASYSHALAEKRSVTYDTFENRFIARGIRDIIIRLKKYRKHIEQLTGSKDYTPLIKKIQSYQSRLQGFLHASPFSEVGKFEERPQYSIALTSGMGYRDFMHIYILLNRGLELADSDIFKIELKDISLLYEYWCFLKLVQLIKEQNVSRIYDQDLIKVKSTKWYVKLAKGNSSRVTIIKENSEETTTIYFNKEFRRDGKKIFTYSQIPDYALEFKKKGFEKPFWYLFDAKYRFEKDAEHKTYNAPKDAIGQLHRYRDAILHTEPGRTPYKNAIRNLGGIILYPYPLTEQEFKKNEYYKSIDHVNIGALPFLPGKTSLVSDFLNRLINKTLPEQHFEQSITTDDAEYIEKRNAWKEFVTIGVIPKKQQMERICFLEQQLLYHVPCVSSVNSRLLGSKYILVCKAGTKEATLYEVLSWEMIDSSRLQMLGTTWRHRSKDYIAFSLKKIKHLQTPQKIAPGNFRFVTLKGLEHYLDDPESDKRYFYLTNANGARLFNELRQIKADFSISWENSQEDPSLIAFKTKSKKVFSSDTYSDLYFKHNGSMLTLNEVVKLFQ